MARTLAAGGVQPGDLLQNAFGYGLFTGGLGAHIGGERLGCTVLPISGGNTERQLKIMRDFGATALALHTVLRHVPGRRGPRPRAAARGHPAARRLPRRRAVDQRAAQADRGRARHHALDIYGLSEMGGPGVAFECPARPACTSTRTTTWPRSSTPRRCGRCRRARSGELVFTTLSREAQPLIRYRTATSAAHLEPCACGRTTGA